MKTTHISFEDHLKIVLEKHPNGITQFVAQRALESIEPELFIQDIFNDGCITGIIGKLIYNKDIYNFFDTHYDEIEAFRQEYELNIPYDTNLNVFLSWATVEEVAYQIYQD